MWQAVWAALTSRFTFILLKSAGKKRKEKKMALQSLYTRLACQGSFCTLLWGSIVLPEDVTVILSNSSCPVSNCYTKNVHNTHVITLPPSLLPLQQLIQRSQGSDSLGSTCLFISVDMTVPQEQVYDQYKPCLRGRQECLAFEGDLSFPFRGIDFKLVIKK